jgi:hypothetical protein
LGKLNNLYYQSKQINKQETLKLMKQIKSKHRLIVLLALFRNTIYVKIQSIGFNPISLDYNTVGIIAIYNYFNWGMKSEIKAVINPHSFIFYKQLVY